MKEETQKQNKFKFKFKYKYCTINLIYLTRAQAGNLNRKSSSRRVLTGLLHYVKKWMLRFISDNRDLGKGLL